MKRMLAMLMAVVMLFAVGTTAFAAELKTGSITIKEAENVSVKNKTFHAYKVLDLKHYNAEKGTYVYTVPEKLKSFYQDYFTNVKDEGDFSAQVVNAINALNGKERFAFAQAVLKAAKGANIKPGSATGTDGNTSVTINNLPLGYYVVEDAGSEKPISALILETTNPNVDVTVKADKPDIDKVIVENGTTTEKNNASIGDIINFKISSKVPEMTGYTKYYFIVTDTMSKGLTFNNDIVVKVGDKTLVQDGENGYSLTTTTKERDKTVIEIVFKNFINQEPGKAIVIEYSATVNENAVIGTAGNPNTVKLEYSNNPNIQDNGQSDNPDKPESEDVIGKTPDEVTYTYVTGIKITKIDQDNRRLQGAEFKITGEKVNHVLVKKDVYTQSEQGTYYKLKNGTYTEKAPDSSTQDQYDSIYTRYLLETKTELIKTGEDVTATGVVGDDGVLYFNGLAAGKYEITELKAPDGYNLLKKPIHLNISWTAPDVNTTECKWNASTGDSEEVIVENGIIKLDVLNKAGSELPSTGGIGTTIFYVVGVLLMALSIVVLVVKKRRSSSNKQYNQHN